MSSASINGVSSQHISVFDRGLLFGEALYEVVPIYQHQPFMLPNHLTRLNESFQTLYGASLPLDKIKQWLNAFIKSNITSEFGAVYIHCSNGANQPFREHIRHTACEPTILMLSYPCSAVDIANYKQGFSAMLFDDTRSALASYKSTQLSINTNALNSAKAAGHHDAIFVKNGYLTEAASSNLFIVKNNHVITPPLDGIVPGITRHLVMMLCQKHNIPCSVRPIHVDELKDCNELFLTSSVKLLKPITHIPDRLSLKQPGKIWEQLLLAYQELTHHAATHQTT